MRTTPRREASLHAIRSQRMSDARSRGTHTRQEWESLKAACNYTCVRCGSRRHDDYVERDHIVPVCLGGSDSIENIQPLCARCNSSKGPEEIDHRPAAWREAVFGVER